MSISLNKSPLVLAAAALGASAVQAETTLGEAITGGNAFANFNMRSENVDQDNALQDASAMTLRTRLGYETGAFHGFSALLELEDSRILFGQDEFTVGPTGFNPGQYSVVADPETTELDQGYLQYMSADNTIMLKLGRQVITYDGHRFVGHVGWRQDRQTFDAVTLRYSPVKDLTLNYGHIGKRNRIFAEDADVDATDHLLNIAYETPIGKLGAYGYLLENDGPADNSLDTWGVSFGGARPLATATLLYALEYATQDAEYAGVKFDTDYLFAEAGVRLPQATVKLGYEVLGSDDGAFGFATPLATLHKFNGWADQFLSTPAEGLEDLYLFVAGKVLGFGWTVVYHDFSADSPSATADDFGDEIDLLVTRTFAENTTVGLKYAAYDAGDAAAGYVDTDKLWAWVTFEF